MVAVNEMIEKTSDMLVANVVWIAFAKTFQDIQLERLIFATVPNCTKDFNRAIGSMSTGPESQKRTFKIILATYTLSLANQTVEYWPDPSSLMISYLSFKICPAETGCTLSIVD